MIDCEAPEILINGDRRAVWDVLSILIEQAAQRSRAESEVRLALADTPQGVEVAIQDTDTSFTTERLLADQRSFWPVPLIVAHGLVALLGGRLWAEQAEALGSRVWVLLPRER
jgi:signal transduction histidine kinase